MSVGHGVCKVFRRINQAFRILPHVSFRGSSDTEGSVSPIALTATPCFLTNSNAASQLYPGNGQTEPSWTCAVDWGAVTMNVNSPELSTKLVHTLFPVPKSDFATSCIPKPCCSLQAEQDCQEEAESQTGLGPLNSRGKPHIRSAIGKYTRLRKLMLLERWWAQRWQDFDPG